MKDVETDPPAPVVPAAEGCNTPLTVTLKAVPDVAKADPVM